MADVDRELMSRAIELAESGDPSPNPHVGCVVARGGEILGEGYHEAVGRDHAELVAIRAAGEKARGATAYITLEPCNHDGRTPPCVDAILAAGIARVVVGCPDPNPHVKGGGIERLRAAGVTVDVGVLEERARHVIEPWVKYITKGASFLSLKLALSLDGRIATRTGTSKWITGTESRSWGHDLRAKHDAVMIGINTVISDDPLLTVRQARGRNPVRVVVDSKLRMTLDRRIVQTASEIPTCVLTTPSSPAEAAAALEAAQISVIRVPATAEGRCDMRVALHELAKREVVSVLCEGGAELAGSLLANQLVDQLHAFVAPILLGPRGRPGAVDWAGPESPAEAPRIAAPRWELYGDDAYVTGKLIYPPKLPETKRALDD